MSNENMADSEVASTPNSQSPEAEEDNRTPNSKKRGSKSSKPRLTAVQKNTNHKDAENKRRTAIRERFTELSQLVPDAAGQERSEQVMLAKTKEYLEASLLQLRELERVADSQGVPIPDDMRLQDNDLGGGKWKQPNLAKYEKSKVKKQAKGTAPEDDIDGEAEDDV